MASLSSLPWSIEGAAEAPALAGFRILTAARPGKPVDFVGQRDWRGRRFRHGDGSRKRWILGGERLARRSGIRRTTGGLTMIVPLRAAGNDFMERTGDDRDSEDAILDTIEKSKKVLAMQRELLQQIAQRRKLVTSIKDTIVNSLEGDVTFPERDISSSLDLSSNGSKAYGSDSLSSNVQSHQEMIPEKPTTTFNGSAGVGSRDMETLDKRSIGGSVSSMNVISVLKTPEKSPSSPNYTSGDTTSSYPEASSRKTEAKINGPGRPLNKSNGRTAHSEQDLAKSSSSVNFALNVGAAMKAEEVTPPAYISTSNASSSLKETLETSNPFQEDVKPPPLAGANVMNVLLVAAECAPWKKTGGLGDVAGALPKALARRGHRVMVVVPRYGNYAEPQDLGVQKSYRVAGEDLEVRYYQAYIDGVDFVFIDSPLFHNVEQDIYGGSRLDVLKRMVLFCKAAVEVPWHVPCGGVCYGDGNTVFIANDWHTALLPVYLKAYYRDNGLMKFMRSVLVIHNIAHQGRGPVDDFSFVDLPEHYLDYLRVYDPIGGEHLNIFAAGLKAADRIVTVSHGYTWEIKTQDGGWGLHNIINENGWKLQGIVNGIDYKEWSPELDLHLKSDGYTNYSLETLETGKAQCKAALQKELGLPVRPDVPLIGFIGRLDSQKGVDLIGEAIPWMMGQDVQLVMLGSGRPDLEEMLRRFESQHKDCIRGWVGFSVKTAHRITAGADILLMPSRFEPCGLNQLYAMCYGTVPVVHAVGGLRDTVQPFDPYKETGHGWTFDRAETGKLIEALGNCLLTYRQYKESWEGLQRRGMAQDLSWDHAAEVYEKVLVAAKYQW